jgi:hypothetical protein
MRQKVFRPTFLIVETTIHHRRGDHRVCFSLCFPLTCRRSSYGMARTPENMKIYRLRRTETNAEREAY